MATNSKVVGGISNLGNRIVNKIWTGNSPDPTLFSARFAPALIIRRSSHASVYDKNLDDQVRPSVDSGDVINSQSDKYWGPHPNTGVFGPDAEQNTVASGQRGLHSNRKVSEGSVLEEKAWFRPTSLEDLEKPTQH